MSFLSSIFSSAPQPKARRGSSLPSNVGYRSAAKFVSVKNNARKKTAPAIISKRGYDAGQINRLAQVWGGGYQHINSDLMQGLRVLRTASKYLSQNDPYFSKYLRIIEKEIVGPEGFTHRNKAVDYVLDGGKTKAVLDKYANKIIQDAFWEWQKKEYSYVTGNVSFIEGNELELKALAVDGEVFIKRVYVNNKENPFGISYQLIEAAYCDESLNKALDNGNYITMGIEHTSMRKPVAYYFRIVEPGAELYADNVGVKYARISADQIIHLYRKEYIGQMRGVPWCAPVATRLHVLKGFEDAVLINARSAARKTAVLIPRDDESILTDRSVSGEYEDGTEQVIIKNVQPGETFVVPQGYDYEKFDPAFPSGSEGPFTQGILQGVSSGLNVDYPTLSSNLSNVNYTSTRHGLLDARAGYKVLQRFYRQNRLEPTAKDFLESAILTGYINLPMSKFQKFNQPIFFGHVGEWVDQYKENKGKELARELLIDTLEEQLAVKGKDLDEHIDQLAEEQKKIKDRLGINVYEKAKLPPAASDTSETTDERDAVTELIEEALGGKNNGNGKH
ncbi:MAG: phage portal protein [Candidatus Roizmanbacteria bacterium]|nr:phage portal protein [Candidatus Roizmanbacteria bacterium]